MANSEHDIQIESDDSNDSDDSDTSFNNSKNSKIGTRAYRNTLEWRRRTRLKKCLMDIKTVVPSLQGKTASNIVIIENLNQYSREWKGRIRQMWQDIQKLQRKYNIPLKQLMTERLEARDRKLTSHVNETKIHTAGSHKSISRKPGIEYMQLSNAEIIEWSLNIGSTHSHQNPDENKD